MLRTIFGIIVAIDVLSSHGIAQGLSADQLIEQIFGADDDAATEAPVKNVTPDPQPASSTTPRSCDCVPYYQCKSPANTGEEGLIDIIVDTNPCEHYIDVCCEKGDQKEVPTTSTPPAYKNLGCGRRNPEGIDLRGIPPNNETQYAEFPWMVAVLREDAVENKPQKLKYLCGGALIHPRVVVTAAHCVTSKKHFQIRAGEWDTQTDKELYPHQDRDVESIVSHPEYYAGALHNDIALLFLKTPVDIAENVDVLCLPTNDTNFDHSRCFVSGWGKDVFGKEGQYQVILKKLDLPVVPRDICQESLRTTRLGKDFDLHKSFICAGGEPEKDTCRGGDGGSPLVCPIPGEKDRWQQAGILSWGISCGGNKTPAVYVNVALFRDWIDEQMKLKGIETESYQY